jgi:hypothetical protein
MTIINIKNIGKIDMTIIFYNSIEEIINLFLKTKPELLYLIRVLLEIFSFSIKSLSLLNLEIKQKVLESYKKK